MLPRVQGTTEEELFILDWGSTTYFLMEVALTRVMSKAADESKQMVIPGWTDEVMDLVAGE